MNLNKYQEKIVKAQEPYVVVNASAAAGKTQTLTERVRFLAQEGVPKDYIVVITFTNAAAEEMMERLGDDGYGIFIGTIHSYANYLLLSSGYDTSKILNEENFDDLFTKVQKHIDCIKPVEYLLLDEAQDTGELEWTFIFDMIKPKNYMLFSDHKQSIYRWKGAHPELIINLAKKEEVTTYPLFHNYRNGRNILNFAKRIIDKLGPDYKDNSLFASGKEGKVFELELDKNYIANMINNSIEKNHNYSDWFILCRTNSQVNEMYYFLKNQNIPCDTFKRADLSNKELIKRMNSNTVKVLTIHAAKGLENKYVVVIGQKFYNEEERCISYVAATRAKELLIWTKPVKRKKKIDVVNWE